MTRAAAIIALHPDLGAQAWDEEAAAYMAHLRRTGLSAHTIRSYGDSLKRWRTFMADDGRDLDPAHATRADVEAFLDHLASTRPLRRAGAGQRAAKPSTIVQRYVGLSTYFAWLASEDVRAIEASPWTGVRRPILPEADTPTVDHGDVGRLLAAVKGRSFAAIRDRAVISLMLSTGARRGEVAGILVEDVDLIAGEVVLHGKGDRARTVRYGDQTHTALQAYSRARRQHPGARWRGPVGDRKDRLREGQPFFLADPESGHEGGLGGSGIAVMIARRCAEAGIPKVHAHQFRHTWADGMKATGHSDGDIMRLGGWRSVEMLNRYGRAEADRRARANYRDPLDHLILPGRRRGTVDRD